MSDQIQPTTNPQGIARQNAESMIKLLRNSLWMAGSNETKAVKGQTRRYVLQSLGYALSEAQDVLEANPDMDQFEFMDKVLIPALVDHTNRAC